MTNHANDLTASYCRCRNHEEFIDTFYELFLSASPSIAEKFVDTDFNTQKLMLRQSLLELLCYDRGITGTDQEIERLGRRHKDLNITPKMYELWLDALCQAIQIHDPAYTPELEQLWRAAMQKPIQAMIAEGSSREHGAE